jgi:hypothetical protein
MCFLGMGVLLLVASVGQATPPTVLDVWIDAERIQRATAVFGDAERDWFTKELARVGGADRYVMFPPPAPLMGFRSPHELNRALIGLLCPSLQRGDVGKIRAFLANVSKQRLIRGRGNYEGWTVVSYHLLQEGGRAWQLEARHHNTAGPGARAKLRREQTAPSFVTPIECSEFELDPEAK